MTNLYQIIEDPNNKRVKNIFIHGFLGVLNDSDHHSLQEIIAYNAPKGDSYLLRWNAGTLSDVLLFSSIVTATVGSTLSPLGAIFLGFGSTQKAIDWAYHFYRTKEALAEKVGKNLFRELGKYFYKSNIDQINLIGHSLGARALHYALSQSQSSHWKINDVVMMGSAAHGFDEDWEDCANAINGKIYNVWSKRDWVLNGLQYIEENFYDLGGDPPIHLAGLHKINTNHRRIVNKGIHTLGHTDYWNNLETVFNRVWDKYEAIGVYCPHCDDYYFNEGDGVFECRDCGEVYNVVNSRSEFAIT